jgi:hypothetical protein
MIIFKTVVVTVLRERGRRVRPAFIERELPKRIDTSGHGGLLAVLHLEPATSSRGTPL